VKVEVSARHGHLSAEHQAEIIEKAEKLLHYFDRLTFIVVTVDLQHDDKVVEVVAHAEHKHEFVGIDRHADMHVALGHAITKVKTQIGHYKAKLQDHRRNPSHGGPEGIHP
jgi:putative sigma-54 modulation protein